MELTSYVLVHVYKLDFTVAVMAGLYAAVQRIAGLIPTRNILFV